MCTATLSLILSLSVGWAVIFDIISLVLPGVWRVDHRGGERRPGGQHGEQHLQHCFLVNNLHSSKKRNFPKLYDPTKTER